MHWLRLTIISIIFLMAFIVGCSAQAGERFEFYNGVRSLGMGGAAAAIVNDETALLLNPAALGKLRNYFVTVADPELDIGEDTQPLIGMNITDFMDPQKTLDNCKAKPGKRLHERLQLFPSFVVTNFGLGVFMRYATDAFVHKEDTSKFDYYYRNDFAFVMGFNMRLFDGRVKLGANARAINRVETNTSNGGVDHTTDIPTTQSGMDFETIIGGKSVAAEGFGLGSDVGLIFTGPWIWLPTFALVYHDVGITSYSINKGMFNTTTDRPSRTPSTLDVAFSITPLLARGTRMTFIVEMVDILDSVEPAKGKDLASTADDETTDKIMRRLHSGVEFNFYDIFFLRGGVNQGYWTAGMELSIYNTQLQFATYGEEVANAPTTANTTYNTKEDRRYVAKFAYRF